MPTTQYLITGRSDTIIQPNVTKFNFTRRNSNVEKAEVEKTMRSEAWSSESKVLAILITVLFIAVFTMFVYILAQVS